MDRPLPEEGPSSGRTWKTALRWLVLALCVGLFVHTLAKTDLRAAWTRTAAVGPAILLILLPYPLALAFDSAAWRRLLAALGHRVPFSVLYRVRYSTEAVGTITPAGAVWAEALAPVLVARAAPEVGVSTVVAASTAKRWLVVRAHAAYATGAAVLGFPALSHASHRLVGSDALVAVVVAGAFGLLLLSLGIEAVAARGRVAGRVSGALGRARLFRLESWIAKRQHHFTDADAAITALSADRRTTVGAMPFLLGLWLCEGCETFLILHLLGADIGLAAVMSFDAALSILRSAAAFAPAGIGVQDLGYLAVLDAYGVPDTSGIAPAFIVLKRSKEAVWVLVGLVLLALARRRPTAVTDTTPAR